MNTQQLRKYPIIIGMLVLAGGLQACGVLEDVGSELTKVCEQTDLIVTKTDDTNDGICTAEDCSLREAVITSNSCPGIQTIHVPIGIYNLTLTGVGEDEARTGDLDIRDHVIIIGEEWEGDERPDGIRDADINGQRSDRLFEIVPASEVEGGLPLEVRIENVWMRDGYATEGGGILNRGNLNLIDVLLMSNFAEYPEGESGLARGGAILSQENGNVTLENTAIQLAFADEGSGLYLQSGELEWNGGGIFRGVNQIGGGAGGCLYIGSEAEASLHDLSFGLCEARTDGGAIYNEGSLEGSFITFNENGARDRGGGLFNAQNAETFLDDSYFFNNFNGQGAAVYNSGYLRILRTGISNNSSSENRGGAIANVRDPGTPAGAPGAELLLGNVTVSGNMLDDPTAPGGAGIYNEGGSLDISLSTIANNLPDGIFNTTGMDIAIRNSILAYHSGGNCSGLPTISGIGNLDDGATCGFTVVGNFSDTDPILLPLTDFGSGGLVHPLNPTSPAVDMADGSRCSPTDQRSMVRPQGLRCDMGAFELETGGSGEPSSAEEGEPTPVPSPTPVVIDPTLLNPISVNFNADTYSLVVGECTRLRWEVKNAENVTLEGETVPALEAEQVCPPATKTYKMVASNSSEEVERFVTIEVSVPVVPPKAPAQLNIVNQVCTGQTYAVTLGWIDAADNEDGYRVYREGALIATLGANATSFTDNPPYGGPYTYGVETFNSAGSSTRPTVQEAGCIS